MQLALIRYVNAPTLSRTVLLHYLHLLRRRPLEVDPQAGAVSRIRRRIFVRRKSAEKNSASPIRLRVEYRGQISDAN